MLTWSKEVYHIYEVDPEKFATTEKAFMHAVHPEDREMVAAAYAESVRNRAVFDVTHRLPMKDGRIKYVQERCEHFYDQQGRQVRSVGTVHDITRQKETEAVLMAAQAELARAKRLSDIGTLAATVAHELRNPLATIGMAASNIKRKAKNRDLDRHLANIDLKVFESNQIINNLLFYSRLRPPQYELVNIHELLEESIRAARGNLKEGVRLVSDIAGLRDVPVEADPIQIKEVLNNLLNNAVDAITGGAGKVEVSGVRQAGCVCITMKDSGEGMDEETLAHAFDPFFTTKAKGTGLGLSVCRQIMDFHKGEITLKSAPGAGAAAHLRLPEKRKPAAAGA
jgi:signal transduction histidine kinase